MALKIADRVKETSLTQGSGSLTLEGAFGGFQTFSATVGDGNTTYYAIENESRWEVGIGTYTSSSNTLSRDTVLKSSEGGDKINIYGVATVFCSYPADRAVIRQEDGLITESGLLTLTGGLNLSPDFTITRDSAGNFFHAYKDDAYDRTIGLYTDGNTSPEWRLGLKNSPSDKTAPPSFGYVYGKDGQVGLIGNSSNSITLGNSSDFSVKHNNVQILRGSSLTGIHLNSNSSSYPAVTINGAAAQSQPLTEWTDYAGSVLSIVDQDGKVGINKTSANYELDVDGSGRLESVYLTSGIYFQDGTFQATAHSDVLTNQVSGWADTTIANGDNAVSGWAGSYADAGDAAVSGWADSTMDTRDAAVSGWANATFITTDNDTTYTAGSGLELHGTEFQAAISGANLLATNTPTDSYVASYDAATGKFTWVANAGGGGATYTAGSGLVLDGDNKFHSTFASGNYLLGEIRDNSSSGVAISGIANFASGLAIQNEIDIATVSGLLYDDSSLSGYVDSRDTAVSGWAKAYVDSQDHSATAVSGWADSTMDTRDAAVSGWAGSYADTGDAAVSGWADSTMDTRDAAVSGYFETRTDQNANDIVSVSGIAAYASGHNLQSITDNGSSTTNSISSSGNITATTGILDVLDLTLLANGSQPAHSEGVVFYDSENHTLSLYNDEADVTLQLGQEEFLRVRNNTGGTIYNGSGVRVVGAHGNAAPTIEPAIASTEQKSQIVGLATHDIENNSFGYVTTYGVVRGVNTVGFSDGDELFLDATTSGNLTNVSPVIPNYKVTVGHVIRSHSNGSILVQIGHPKLGGGDLKSEGDVTLSGVPFVTSAANTNAGGMQTNSSFVYDSGNNQLQLGSGVQLLNAVPGNTTNVLYNDGGTLKFNGSAVDTNTTYTGGTNLTLDGTTFNVDDAFLKNNADDTTSGTVTMANLIVGDAGNIGSASDNDAVAIASDGEVTLSQRTTFSKAQKTPIKSNTDGATITFDLDEANTHTVTLGGDRTLALSNANVGQRFVIRLVQDGTGTRTITWFSTINWPGGLVPTLTTTGGKTDVFGFICTATNTYDGFVIGYNL